MAMADKDIETRLKGAVMQGRVDDVRASVSAISKPYFDAAKKGPEYIDELFYLARAVERATEPLIINISSGEILLSLTREILCELTGDRVQSDNDLINEVESKLKESFNLYGGLYLRKTKILGGIETRSLMGVLHTLNGTPGALAQVNKELKSSTLIFA